MNVNKRQIDNEAVSRTNTEEASKTNRYIADKLEQLAEQIEDSDNPSDAFRASALFRSSNIIRNLGRIITVPERDLKGLKGIGLGTINRTREIIETGTLRELEEDNVNQESEIDELTSVRGIGPVFANKLHQMNIYTLKQLSEAIESGEVELNRRQQEGFEEIYDNLTSRCKTLPDEGEEITHIHRSPRRIVDRPTFKPIIGDQRQPDDELLTIYGIGPAFARLLHSMNIHTIEDLKYANKTKEVSLNERQLVGLKNYKQLNSRIPRKEVEQIGNQIIEEWLNLGQDHTGEIVGSYRRGLESSGDVDILVTDSSDSVKMFKLLIDLLKRRGIIQYAFSCGKIVCHTIGGLSDGPLRKIDIRYIKPESWSSALLHYTGSQMFNITLRRRAERMGYKLSEYGLLDLDTDQYLVVESEDDIFRHLDMDYVPPEERSI